MPRLGCATLVAGRYPATSNGAHPNADGMSCQVSPRSSAPNDLLVRPTEMAMRHASHLEGGFFSDVAADA